MPKNVDGAEGVAAIEGFVMGVSIRESQYDNN
jgi:hypothetical protein